MSMQYMVAIIIGCVVFVAIVALVFICCCCRRRNSKLKNKTADMEVSHRGVVAQQVKPPPKQERNLCRKLWCYDTFNYYCLLLVLLKQLTIIPPIPGSTPTILHRWYGQQGSWWLHGHWAGWSLKDRHLQFSAVSQLQPEWTCEQRSQ